MGNKTSNRGCYIIYKCFSKMSMWAIHSYSFLNLLHVKKVNTLILRYYVPLSIRISKNWKGRETIGFRDL